MQDGRSEVAQLKTLRTMTQKVYDIVHPVAACWESSLMLRDALTRAGIPARLTVVTVHGSDAHCVVICGEYVCDPTVFQFGTGDEWTVVPLAGSPYTLGGNAEFTANIRELENADGLRCTRILSGLVKMKCPARV